MYKLAFQIIRSWEQVLLLVLTVYAVSNFLVGFLGMSLMYSTLFSLFGHAFGLYQVHLLGSLSEKLKKFDEENTRLEQSNEKLKENVTQFQEQNLKLKSISDNLREENANFKKEVEHLSSTISGLETVKQTIELYAEQNKQDFQVIIQKLNSTLDEQKKVVNEQHSLLKQAKEQSKCQEKLLLLTLHSQCQFLDQSMGMSSQEFQLWVNQIPKKYLNSPIGMEFSKIDENNDGIIDVREFNALLDNLVKSVE